VNVEVGLRPVARGLPSTFSIVAADPGTGEVGCAVQSKYFAVGTVVPWATAGVGAVATQAAGVAVYGSRVLERLADGLDPDEALSRTLADDDGRETRQLGVVTADGRAAAFTGAECNEWAGHETGSGYAVQGNILAGPDVTTEMARAFRETGGTLAERLVASLEAGQAAGGDRRGQQSAAVVVERTGGRHEGREGIDRVTDLRVDDHAEPIAELRRLLDIHLRWDVLRRASGFHRPDGYEDGIRVLAAGLERFGDDATILYDLACYEALAGRRDDAVAHLRRSLELEPAYREMAAGDTDFASLAEASEFRALVD
jgi:uncharacterized Ntn-hydrolase superfamily protein